MKPGGFVDVDKLQAETTLQEAAAKCGVSLDVRGDGAEVRIDCPFNCAGDHAGRKEVAINTENPQKVFQCHAYQCQFKGNLLTLMHGMLAGQKPTGGKLKGEEFQRVKTVLASKDAATPATAKTEKPKEAVATPPPRNVPLIESTEEAIRQLATIDEKFVTDIAKMNPAASAYVRKHNCLTPESMKKWRVGYLPNDGGGDKRGWSLRGSIIYPVLSETGQVLTWVGRDVHFDEKERDFARLSPAERKGQEPPAKHRFPKGFARGQELYGQQASRLQEPGYREFIAKNGLVIVEGFNDVIGLDNLGVPALGILSNRITEQQVEKLVKWAKQLAGGRVTLMFDNDPPGIEGMKDALWQLTLRELHVRIAWTPESHGGTFAGTQPENLTNEDTRTLLV
jgi:hypothetical protein